LTDFGGSAAGALSMSWVTATTSGHTKKLTMHAMWFVGYSVGQMVAPQWWKNKYKPRNRVPWTILLVRSQFWADFIGLSD
jgi:ACS family allantoate permease-like MFS transporter